MSGTEESDEAEASTRTTAPTSTITIQGENGEGDQGQRQEGDQEQDQNQGLDADLASDAEMDCKKDFSDEDPGMVGIVFHLFLHQTPLSLQQKMRFPELCRNFSAIAWCGRLNVIACASETCARDPSSNVEPPFWIPIHIVNPERPTEHTVFNVTADSPCDFVQFIEWSPISCPRALLIANFNGRVNIWSQPTQGPVNLARAVNCWYCEHEWRQDLAVVTKWLSGMSPYRWYMTNSSASATTKFTFDEKYLSHQPQSSGSIPFLHPYLIFTFPRNTDIKKVTQIINVNRGIKR